MDQLLLQVRKMDHSRTVDMPKPALSQVVKELPEVFGQKSVLLVTASLQDEPCHVCSLATETPIIGAGHRLIWKSRVMREYQARFCESLGVQLPLATRLCQIRTINSRKCFPASPQLVNISKSHAPISCFYQVAHEGEEG